MPRGPALRPVPPSQGFLGAAEVRRSGARVADGRPARLHTPGAVPRPA
ncbi:hypothetical protein [Streptomyces uncialis]|nr:hypothetical protein OG268_34995 [Streptomyces uncialis]